MPYQYYNYPQPNRKLPFLETLDFPYLSKLINHPILHDPFWPTIPVELPSYIPKSDGKQGEDKKNVMTFHLWFSLNSLMDDSILLRLFQIILIGTAAKWYIELPQQLFMDFNLFKTKFLTLFHLSIHYETGIYLLTSL